jgi:hypothetical protein
VAIRVGSVSVEVVPDARGFAEKLRAQLADIGGVTIDIKADTAVVDAQLAELAKDRTTQIRAEVEEAAKAKAELDETAKERKARLRAEADVTKAEQQLAAVAKARSVEIKAEVDIAAAEAKLAKLSAAKSPKIKPEVDAGSADKTDAELDWLARQRKASIKVDTDSSGIDSMGVAMKGILATGVSLGPLVGASLAVAAAGAAVIGTAVVAAAGVTILGLHGITAAIQAESAAGKAAGQDAIDAAQKRIADTAATKAAVDGLANAEASAADGAISAAEAVSNAKRSAVDAAISAAQSVTQALTTERTAENSLVTAQQSEQRAQQALTQARKDAQRQLEDLAQQAADGALSQRGATLSLQEAQQSLNNTMMDPLATNLQKERAQLNYDQAKQQLSDISSANQRTAQDKATADKKGVDGAQGVISAQDQLRSSVVAVGSAQAAVAASQRAYSDAQRKAAEGVVVAEQAVTDAVRAQATQARTSAASLVTAQAAVSAAQRQSTTDANTASTSQKALAIAMAALTPAGRAFVDFYQTSLKPALKDMTSTAQSAMLPGLQKGLQAILSSGVMTNVKEAIGKIATVLGELFQRAGQALGSPFWKQFIDFIGNTAGPVLRILAPTLGNIARGLASMLQAFAPVALQMGAGFQNMTAKFAAWAAQLGQSKGFHDFVDYVKTNGPLLLRAVGDILKVFGALVVAIAPLAGPLLRMISASFSGITQTVNVLRDAVRTLSPVLSPFISLLKTLSNVMNGLHGVGGGGLLSSLVIPGLPHFATGGIVSSPTLGLFGEAGPEAVVPLNQAGALAASLGQPGAPGVGTAGAPEVRVFIGDQELTSIVRTQVIQHDSGQARQLAYGRAV